MEQRRRGEDVRLSLALWAGEPAYGAEDADDKGADDDGPTVVQDMLAYTSSKPLWLQHRIELVEKLARLGRQLKWIYGAGIPIGHCERWRWRKLKVLVGRKHGRLKDRSNGGDVARAGGLWCLIVDV